MKGVGKTMSTKKLVLELLERERGKSISGEHLAEQLNVSRNTIWKAIKELEKDGYKITAATNKGYCFCESNDILSVQGLFPFLSAKENFNNIYVYDSLASTNKTAKEMAIAGAKQGTVIIADHQTAGKGRYGRDFFSPQSSGIYMSFILRPTKLSFDSPTAITAFAAVSVCQAIETLTSKSPQIKWVNDIFLDEKKICGILTEAVTDFESGTIQWIVVGIGINFATPTTGFPEGLKEIAGSIFSADHPTITRNHLAAEVINRIMACENQIEDKEMFSEYRKRLMMLGEKITVTGVNESFEAIAVDIDDIGRLEVRKSTGEMLILSAGEVSIIK